jgi:hypothetical protein
LWYPADPRESDAELTFVGDDTIASENQPRSSASTSACPRPFAAWTPVARPGADLAFGEVTRADRAAINRLVIAEERKQRRIRA